MAKKLADIEKEIKSKEPFFYSFLKKILDNEVILFLNRLNSYDNLYLFSGVIRNYFLGIYEVRDIDIMLDSTKKIEPLLEKYEYRRNSFGGYKIKINNTSIDLWYLKDTWALNNSQKVFDFELEKHIPNTSFFNFSSIIYSFKDESFIYSKPFLRFLRDKKIDYVFKPNANYALCVVNSFYYSDKLHLELTDRLKKYLKELNKKYFQEYEKVQIKHFGKIIYTQRELIKRFEQLFPKDDEKNID